MEQPIVNAEPGSFDASSKNVKLLIYSGTLVCLDLVSLLKVDVIELVVNLPSAFRLHRSNSSSLFNQCLKMFIMQILRVRRLK